MTLHMETAETGKLPRFGLGAAGLGNLYSEISEAEAMDTLLAARDAGLDLIDTSPFYGHGLSERRIGDCLAQTGWRPALSTKVGRVLEPAGDSPVPDNGFASPAPFIPRFDYSAGGIRRAFAGSRSRLGVDRVNTLLLHDIGRVTHCEAHEEILLQALREALPEMAAMKAEGLTARIGLGVNEIEICQEVIGQFDLDILLIAGRYTLLEHEASLNFLDTCHDRGIHVMIGGAFNSGLLAAAAGQPLHYDYDKAPDWAVEKTARLRQICARFEVPLPAAALQFCAAHPAVATVLAGGRTSKEVRQTADWTRTKIDPDLWAALQGDGLISENAPVPA
ncbi:aldo/keto reductase [Henriciella sp.]|uniref:aldo/keto reductase n=1 Tax=Henriciella sp. TaxID=1968823 RepID=UPI002637EB54|nr:aldo/keto reductase [Henriciella sp.]